MIVLSLFVRICSVDVTKSVYSDIHGCDIMHYPCMW